MTLDPLTLPKPNEPYRGILPFRLLDWRVFFEREAEIERLTNLVSLYRGVLLYGQSGTGKSSLLNAGLMAYAMRRGRAPERIRLYPQKGKELFLEPISLREGDSGVASQTHSGYLPSRFIPPGDTPERVQLSCAELLRVLQIPSESLGPPLLIFDQFEELVTLFEENPRGPEQIEEARGAQAEIQRLICELLLNTSLPVKAVFAFRDDYLARLIPLFSRIPHLFDQAVRLERPKIELLQRIVRGPFLSSQERGISAGDFGPELSEELAQKIESGMRANQPSGLLNLSEVQTLCLALWRQPKLQEELLRPGADTGAILRRIIESEAMVTLNQLRLWDRFRAIAVLSNLVTEDGTRNVVPQQILVTQTRRNPLLWIFRGDWRKFLDRLLNTGLVRRSLSSGTNYYYELVSESLIPRIQKWQQQLLRRRQLILACICAFLVGFPSYEWYRAKKATVAAKAARQNSAATKQDADKALSFMQYDVSDTLRKLGQPEMMKKINDFVRAHFEKFPPEADDFEAKRAEAVATLQHGDLLEKDGHLREGLDEQQKALKRFLWLGEHNNKFDYQQDIALGHERVASLLRAQGNLSGALENYRETFRLRHAIAISDPLNSDVQRELAITYNDLGTVLSTQGDLTGALKNYRDSLAIREVLATEDPGNADAQGDLSASYNNIGDVLSAQGDLTGALKSYRDSLAIRETLAEHDLSNTDWQRDLSISYDNIGNAQAAQGDLTGALKSYGDSLAIRGTLAKQDPGNVDWQRDLSISYNNIGYVQRVQGDLTGALKSYRDSLAIREALAKQDLGNADAQRDLSMSYNNIGDVLSTQGDLTGALKSYRDSLAIEEALAKQDPDNAGWQHDLSVSYNNIGDVLITQGDLTGALKSYRDSLAIREKLAKQDPGNADWQRDFSFSYNNVGDVQRAQGDLTGALKSYGDSLAIREKLVKQDPGNAGWQHELAAGYDALGGVQRDQKNFAAALKSCRDCQVILEKLVKQDSSNADWRRDLAVSYEHIGDVQMDQKDFDGALKSYREALTITEKLRQQDSNNFGWQSDLSDRYADIGKVLRDQGDLVGALKNYRDSLGIREKLAIRDPSNAGWQAGLGWIYWQTGAVLEKVQPGSKGEGLAMVGKGHDILRDLKNRNALTAEQQKWLDEIETELGKAKKPGG
jgi:tetratricopeptide (TPR) repeat protein